MGFFRLLVFLAVVYLFYRVGRHFLGSAGRIDQREGQGTIDEMVQDPQCGTYIPLREARRAVVGGKKYFFCSKQCEDSFEGEMKQ